MPHVAAAIDIYRWTYKYGICVTLVLGACYALAADTATGEAASFRFKTACGPISAYVALRQLGYPATLESLAQDLNWSEGSLTPLRSIRDLLNSMSGIRCEAVRLSPEQLDELVNRHKVAVILVIRKGSEKINHAVCVRRVSPRFIEYADYPELVVRVGMATIPEVWDGQALVVQRVMWDNTTILLLAVDATALVLYASFWLLRRQRPSVHNASKLASVRG